MSCRNVIINNHIVNFLEVFHLCGIERIEFVYNVNPQNFNPSLMAIINSAPSRKGLRTNLSLAVGSNHLEYIAFLINILRSFLNRMFMIRFVESIIIVYSIIS